jgi:hypothetical protein
MTRTRRSTRRSTPEDREARRAAERDQVIAAVKALQTSDGWLAWAKVRKAFRRYSPLILSRGVVGCGGPGVLRRRHVVEPSLHGR